MVFEKLPFRFWGNWFTLKLWKKHWNEFQANTLYATDSYVVSLAVNQNGTGFLSGHADGSIIRWYVADDTSARSQVRIPEVPNLLIATYCRMMLFRSQFIKNCNIQLPLSRRTSNIIIPLFWSSRARFWSTPSLPTRWAGHPTTSRWQVATRRSSSTLQVSNGLISWINSW